MRDIQLPGRSPVYAERGICATSHPLAASAAVDILRQGGNAVDAAIAGAVLLGICEPQMTGLGGDCFALISPAGSDDIHALNGSGRAPAGLDADALRARGLEKMPLNTADAVTVPGAVAGFAALSEKFGRQGLAASLAPAIDYAETGVPVAPRVAFDWTVAADALKGDARSHFLFDGKPPQPGQVFRAPGQARALRAIAEHGAEAFYSGAIAADMLSALHAEGGVHTEQDFATQQADWVTPVHGHYRDVEIVEHPPNGQGAVAILMLKMLERYDMAALDPLGAERVHLEAEIAKLAYDARNRLLADPEFMTAPDRLLNPAFATSLSNLVHRSQALPDVTSVTEAVHRDTVYITVVDRDRMAVSLIYSIFHSFGSGIASPEYGILLQNRGAGFSLQPGHPNEVGPGKRPMHTIIPGMMRRGGRVVMPFGVMGGQYQPAGHVRLVGNLVDYGMDPQQAIDAPRAFPIDGELLVERGFAPHVGAHLTRLGHKVVPSPSAIGGAQAIWIDPDSGCLIAGSDPRKDGAAVGY